MQTYHPPDKDYGHMKVEEPKTPFNYANPDDQDYDQLDADVLAERYDILFAMEWFEIEMSDNTARVWRYDSKTITKHWNAHKSQLTLKSLRIRLFAQK